MDETIGFINFNNVEDVSLAALRFARDAEKGHAKLVQLIYELMKQPEPEKSQIEMLVKH